MLIPARVVAAFTDPQRRSVDASASGIESRNSLSLRVNPLCTRAEYPPTKSTPTVLAASSIARPRSMGLPRAPSVKIETGVTAMRLFAIRMPISSPIWSTVLTKSTATRSIFSRTRSAVLPTDSVAQSRKLNPSVTVRMSRCSISVMRMVSRISAWLYSMERLATEARRRREKKGTLGRVHYFLRLCIPWLQNSITKFLLTSR